jgi:acyl-CoA carboxylase subunit beta
VSNLAAAVVDQGSFDPIHDELSPRDPLGFDGYSAALEGARRLTGHDEAVACGPATCGGHPVELIAFDFRFMAGSMGEVVGERVARGLERASARGVPVVLVTATGGARMQEGMRSLIQMPKLVAARIELAGARVPLIALLAHPTTGGVLASIGSLSDFTLAQARAIVGFSGPRVVARFTGVAPSPGSHTAEAALGHGLVDAVVEGHEAPPAIRGLVTILAPDAPEPAAPPQPVTSISLIDPWETVQQARGDERPTSRDLIATMMPGAFELRGDRAGSDDPGITVAVGRVLGRRLISIGANKGRAPGPAAYRKARRAVGIAGRLGIPILTLIDTKGADPSPASEAGGISASVAHLMQALLEAPVPVVSVVVGEGGSGGALALAPGDIFLAYEHSIFSVIAPEAAAEILWRDGERGPEAARRLRLCASDLVELGVADGMLPDPPDGPTLGHAVAHHIDALAGLTPEQRGAERLQRWRMSGT